MVSQTAVAEREGTMRFFCFDQGVSRHVEHHGSSFLQCVLARTSAGMVVSVMHLRPGDHVGRHVAVVPRLFAVIEGTGHVQGESGADVPTSAGQAAFWSVGESHAAQTDRGMTAVVLEGPELDPPGLIPDL